MTERLKAAILAEREYELEIKKNLYSNNNIKSLQEKGLVLLDLKAKQEGMLYQNYIYK